MPWWARLLLRFYPEAFRRAHGDEVAQLVTAELERAGSRRARRALWLAWDLAMGALRHFRRQRASDARRGRGGGRLMGMGRDLRLAARRLLRQPTFTLTTIATLALGLGLSTSVFTLVNAVLLEPLSFAHPDELVYVEGRFESDHDDDALVSGGDWRMLRDGVHALGSVEGFGLIRQNLTGAGLPRQVQVGWASPGFLGMLGVRPALGRLFDQRDPPGTAVLSHALWVEALAGDPEAVGRTVTLDGHAYTVVGVLPSTFRVELPAAGGGHAPRADLWKNPDDFWQNGDAWSQQGPEYGLLHLVGRLAPGRTIADAQTQVNRVVASLRERDARYADAGFRVVLESFRDHLVQGVTRLLALLSAAVACVLLIACANVTSLLLIRARGRQHELALHLALGAPRHRLGRGLLFESFIIASAGTVAGLGLATMLVHLTPGLAPETLPRTDAVGLDRNVLAFAVCAVFATTLLVGTLPMVVGTRVDAAIGLGRSRTSGHRNAILRDALVVGQVALSLILLVGTGLLTSSVRRLSRVDPGFDLAGLFTYSVSVPGARYGWPDEAARIYRRVQRATEDLPGVTAAGIVWPMPLSGTWTGPFEVGEGSARRRDVVPLYLATEEYFVAAGIPLLEGRLFRDGDRRDVVVATEEFARRAFPDESAVGRTLRANPWGGALRDFRVIGVVGDVRQRDLREAPEGGLYFDVRGWSWVDWEVHVVARTDVAAEALIPALRQAVAGVDPEVPVADPEPMSARVARETANTRIVVTLLGLFSAAAGALALVGLYGVVSDAVGQRRREIGVRMSLGSSRARIQATVVRRGLVLACVGIALGAPGALGMGTLLRSQLFEIGPGDPVVFALAGGAMAVGTLLASWLPARRAARMEPVEVLKDA